VPKFVRSEAHIVNPAETDSGDRPSVLPFAPVLARPRASSIADLLTFVAISAFIMAAVAPSRHSQGAWIALPLVPVGALMWWISGLELKGWHDVVGALLVLAYLLLAVVYICVLLLASIWDPTAAILVLGSQLLAVMYMILR
jgi:hypothetical protein